MVFGTDEYTIAKVVPYNHEHIVFDLNISIEGNVRFAPKTMNPIPFDAKNLNHDVIEDIEILAISF